MLERTKRKSFKILFISSKVEPELDFQPGSCSGKIVPVPQHWLWVANFFPFASQMIP